MEDKEKIRLYEEFLISLHTAHWTGNGKRFAQLVTNAGAFSYSRTNSTGDEQHDELMKQHSLENLLKKDE